jgi:subtilisin family serine protease
MPNADRAFPVEIFYNGDAEEKLAREMLEDVEAVDVVVYDSLIEAMVMSDAIDAVASTELEVDFPEGLPSDEPAFAADEDEATRYFPDLQMDGVDRKVLDAFQKSAKYVGMRKKAAKYIKDAKGLVVPPEVFLRKTARKVRNVIIDGLNIEGLSDPIQQPPSREELLDLDVYRVRLSGRMRDAWREEFKKIGVSPGSIGDPRTWTMFADKTQLAKVRAMPFVRAVKRYGLVETVTGPLRDALRRLEGVPKEDVGRDADVVPHPDCFDLVVHRPNDLQEVRELIDNTTGATVIDYSETVVRFKCDLDSPLLAALANLPQTRTVTPYASPKLFCNFVRDVIGVQAINQFVAAPQSEWDGSGEIIAVIDSGIDDGHPDLEHCTKSKINFGSGLANDVVGHGSHVAGIIAGSGAASNGEIRGVAPGATIVSVGIVDSNNQLDLPVDLGRLLSEAVNLGAKTINLSLGWSKRAGGEYQVQGESVDRFIHENPEVLVIVAAGNEGEARQGTHEFNTLGMPATAKNVLTVGASASSRPDSTTWGQERLSRFPAPPAANETVSGNPELVAALSSRGPTDAKLTKPDIVAPGTRILSVRASNATINFNPTFPDFNGNYGFLSGTSMAAPAVSGAVAITRQYLREELSTTNCSAALLKAILIASAQRLPSSPGAKNPEKVGYPDFEQGFGRIDLNAIIPPKGSGHAQKLHFFDVANDSDGALRARQPPGQVHKSVRRYSFSVGAGADGPLRIVLTWTDPPGQYLQNDLHLSVSTPEGATIMGNSEQLIFRRAWEELTGKIGPDKENVVEYVLVNSPPKGKYRVKVVAQDTPTPPQGYALCVVGELDDPLAESF